MKTKRNDRLISMKETAEVLAKVRSNQPRVTLQQAQDQAARLMGAGRNPPMHSERSVCSKGVAHRNSKDQRRGASAS